MLLPSESWFDHLVTDPRVIGIVTWLGLLVTMAGFGIALAQIRKIKRSSESASHAVASLVKVVRSHEQHGRIANAIAHLTSAQIMIKQSNTDAATAYLSVSWSALIGARELSDDEDQRQSLEKHVVATRKLLDDVNAPGVDPSPRVTSRRNADVNKLLDGLGALSAKLHSALSGIGPAS